MMTKEELLRRLWSHINSYVTPYYMGRALVREDELDRIVEEDRKRPGETFADTGPAIERILAAGAARRDLCLVLRWAAYGAVFDTLHQIDPDPEAGAGVDCKDLVGLHEWLLSADPSGMEGRPGSADAITAMHRPK